MKMVNNKQRITRRIEIDYGHTLPAHYSFCSQIHGHRGFIEATVEGEIVNEYGSSSQGMVYDFKILKEIMMEHIHNIIDHGFAVWKNDKEDLDFIKKRNKKYLITEEPPTAEYLAKWAFFQIHKNLPSDITLIKLRWYETPNGWADYTFDDYRRDGSLNSKQTRLIP